LVYKLCDNINFWVLLLNDIVLENSLGIKKILFIISILLITIIFFSTVIVLLLRLVFHFDTDVRGQDHDLFRFHDVHSVVGFLLEGAALDEVDLGEELELLPLLRGGKLVVEDDDRERVFHVLCSQRQHEMLDVLHHTANDDMVLCQHRIFHGIEYDVFPVHWLVCRFCDVKPISFNVVDIDVYLIIVSIKPMILRSNDCFLILIKTMKLILILIGLVGICKDLLCRGSIISDNIAEITVLVGFRKRLRQLVVSRIEQDISVLFSVHLYFESKKEKVSLLVDITRNITETFISK
jgi:hypothetical protein